MRAKELMKEDVLLVHQDDLVEDVLDVLVGEHIQGAPVVDDSGKLVGVVSQLDVYFGTMTRSRNEGNEEAEPLRVKEIMTSPAVSAGEEAQVVDLCRMMYKLRIHRVPIVRDGAVVGIISSLDVCAALAEGRMTSG